MPTKQRSRRSREAAVRAVIDRSSEAQKQAFAALETAPLEECLTGPFLEKNLRFLEQLRAQRQRYEMEGKVEIVSVEFPDASHAVVKARETEISRSWMSRASWSG